MTTVRTHLRWTPHGYHCWTNISAAWGWRQIGAEVLCRMDDFGDLFIVAPVGDARVEDLMELAARGTTATGAIFSRPGD